MHLSSFKSQRASKARTTKQGTSKVSKDRGPTKQEQRVRATGKFQKAERQRDHNILTGTRIRIPYLDSSADMYADSHLDSYSDVSRTRVRTRIRVSFGCLFMLGFASAFASVF